jgi:carbamoyltransferase
MAQRALELACADLVAHALEATGERQVALAGGIASNVKLNRRIRLLPGVDDVFVFPHMGDGGLALGAAALARHEWHDPEPPLLGAPALGPTCDEAAIERALSARRIPYLRCESIGAAVADLLARERVVLWVQGRMEYGPRALGHRSVLARADRPGLRDRLNLVLKRRVWYQPFCPSLLESEARRLLMDFTGSANRHMTMAYMVAPGHRAELGGVINVDGSCRPQMVSDDDAGPFGDLLRALRDRTGVGAVLNTSLNLHGSPMACTPDQALDVFEQGGADAIAMGPYLAVSEAGAC